MVPWCGRIRDGLFRDGAAVHHMPLNAPPHAIHGTARDAAWRTARRSTDEAVYVRPRRTVAAAASPSRSRSPRTP
ncbi:hypothetical protein SGRIM128S_05496 [Streptomyces griseomycini]